MALAIKQMLAAWYAGRDGQAAAPCPPWLRASGQEPEAFTSALWSHAVTPQPPFSADGFNRVTLYHDLRLRHPPSRGAGPLAWRDVHAKAFQREGDDAITALVAKGDDSRRWVEPIAPGRERRQRAAWGEKGTGVYILHTKPPKPWRSFQERPRRRWLVPVE